MAAEQYSRTDRGPDGPVSKTDIRISVKTDTIVHTGVHVHVIVKEDSAGPGNY